MEYRTLELNILSAKDLKDVNMFSKMDVYAVVSVYGDPLQTPQAKTHVHKDAGKNPTWNFPMKFSINETLAQQNRISLEIKLISDRTLAGDTVIGTVHVPAKEILDNPPDGDSYRQVTYQVRRTSGKTQGSLIFSYKFGEKVEAPKSATEKAPPMAYPPPAAGMAYHQPPPMAYPQPADVSKLAPADGSKHEPVMAYPATGAAGPSAGSYGAYPPPQYAAGGYGAPAGGYGAPAGGYGYPPQPPQPGYGYPPQPGYGYPGQQPGYGYAAAQKPKKNKVGMGLGAGLLGGALGGLLIGDMVSDVAAYDAGYDAGFDDGGFDF